MRFATVEATRQARDSLVGREQPGQDRDERRRQRAGGDELEDEVRDPERGEERVELALAAERRRR